jgi:drug/metabolite transporter (DMT)-like permease
MEKERSLSITNTGTNTGTNAGRGYAMAAGAAMLWGLSGAISKFLFRGQVRPSELITIRTMLAAIFLFSLFALTSPKALRIRRADIFYFLPLGLLGLAGSQFLYYLALDLTSVGFALLLQYLAPLLLMGYGVLAKTERLSGGKVIAALTAIGGCALMVFGQEGGLVRVSYAGVAFALGSACAFAFYTGYGQHGVRRYDARAVLAYAFLSSAAAWLVLRPPWTLPWTSYDRTTWGCIIYLASFATVLPFGLYLASLRHLEASRANLTSMLEPVVATTIAWAWLGERMTPLQILGAEAVLGGVLLLQVESATTGAAHRGAALGPGS